MIDPSIFHLTQLVEDLLVGSGDQSVWRLDAEIVVGYRSPRAGQDSPRRCVVRLGDLFLRHSAGPRQGHFWDCHGDDYIRPSLALVALMQADAPPWLLKPEARMVPAGWEALRLRDAAAATAAQFRRLVVDTFGDAPTEEIQNQYCPCDRCPPWFIARTVYGDVELGWRKRVIHISWSGTGVALPDLFADQDVTKWQHGVHAWGYEKAAEYLRRLAEALHARRER